MKREVFLVADAEVGRFPDTEAGLLDRLAHDERYILEHHPHAATQSWRALAKVGGKPRDGIAAHMIERLYELRDALGDPSTPVWKAARLGISYQNLVMVYRQPLNQKNVGAVVRKGQPGRRANDELCMAVLRALKGSGLGPDQAVDRMRELSGDWEKIADVEIDFDAGSFIFRQRRDNLPDREESFSEATIRRHKWSKA